MSGYDDPIPAGRFTSMNVVEALRAATHMPVEAIELGVRAPGRLAEPVLRVVAAAAEGSVLDERDRNLLFWGVHVLGAARETRLYEPLLRLLRRPGDDVADLLAEAVGSTLPRIVASVFDGHVGALEAVLADRDADEAVRWSLWGALAFLTADGRIARDRTRAILLRFDEDRPARAGDAAWAGWEAAVALGGFADLADRVAAARADARLLDDGGGAEWFAATLAEADAEPDDRARFADADLGYVENVLAELEAALADAAEAEAPEPVRNPLRDVGRNDPCPCGSGRKYKKCCLAGEGGETAPTA